MVASFIGAAFGIFLNKLIENPTDIGNWVGFILAIIILFIIAKKMLSLIRKSN